MHPSLIFPLSVTLTLLWTNSGECNLYCMFYISSCGSIRHLSRLETADDTDVGLLVTTLVTAAERLMILK